MTTLSRHSLLRSFLALTAAGRLARPFIANAAAATAEPARSLTPMGSCQVGESNSW